MLVDSVEIELKAGRGGNGVVSWRREKFVPKGGPDGGDGGRGGNVILRSSHNADTLSTFRFRKVFKAGDGKAGAGKKKTGADADDLELTVPIGTRVINLATSETLHDFDQDQDVFVVARGGKGGLGNIHFVSSTHQNPFESTEGKPGQSVKVRLELQFVADIALVGEPNAGKSSIIAALTGASARIGAYPFSTTDPVLGVMKHGDREAVLIDLPGLIEGAHQGKGLGLEFLKHTKRVKGIVHVLEATHPNLDVSEKAVLGELARFDPELPEKPRIVALNKSDLLTSAESKKLKKDYPDAVILSAKEKLNLNELREKIFDLVGS